MGKHFREDRATQVASRLLELAGGSLDVLPLVKLIYMVDRTHLERFGRTVTGDTFYNMPHGPVVSSTLDCIKAKTDSEAPIWRAHINGRQEDSYAIVLLRPAEPTELSPMIEAIIEEVFEKHGRKTFVQWRQFAHELPEWHAPETAGSEKLRYRDVLRAVGWDEEDIDSAFRDFKGHLAAARVFADE